MIQPPSGTVTFLFTDIEGSTNLAQQYPEAMPNLLARHHAILRQAIEAHHGYVFRIVGDGFCAAFPTASDALEADAEVLRRGRPTAEQAEDLRGAVEAKAAPRSPAAGGGRALTAISDQTPRRASEDHYDF